MKKFIYVCILFMASVMARGEIGFVIDENAKKAFTFDNMSNYGEGFAPLGWIVPNPSGNNGSVTAVEQVPNRYGEENKAVKFVAEITGTSATWHVNSALLSGNTNWKRDFPNEYSEFSMPLETDFYYTFWAKSETEGNKLYMGMMQLYSGNFTGAAWAQTPVIELTTNWTKYAIKINKESTTADKNKNSLTALTEFRIHFRESGIQYIDDIEFALGHDLPADVGHYFVDGVEHDANGNVVVPTNPDFIIGDNAKKAFTFDTMVGSRPFGWIKGKEHANGEVSAIEHVSNRYGEDDKAVKFTANIANSGTTWHVNVVLLANNDGWVNEYSDEYSEFSIPLETDFYYTFWAKSEVKGNKLYVGPMQVWNNGNFTGAAWGQTPAIELTTNWTKYAIKVNKEQTAVDKKIGDNFTKLTEFRIHFRESGVQYIDDIEIALGTQLPDDIGHYFINGIEHDADGNPLTPIESPLATDQKGQTYDLSEDIPTLDATITSLILSGLWSAEDYLNLEQKITNPNCLVYLPADMTLLPELESSVNYIVGGVALSDIILVDSNPANNEFYPYHCPETFSLGDNSIIYEFTQFDLATPKNGWNTLSLPFDGVLKIDNIAKTPFESDEDKNGEYWLKEYTKNEEETVLFSYSKGATIKKNTPYLIAIPGKSAFGENGYDTEKVTIEANGISVEVTPAANELKETIGSYSFVANYQVIEEENIYVLERGEDENADSFVQYEKNGVLPFRAYFEGGSDQVRRLTIGNDKGTTGFNLAQKNKESMNIYVSGTSVVIESETKAVVNVYSVDGQLMRTVTVQAGYNVVNNLQSGIYIVNGQKIVICR